MHDEILRIRERIADLQAAMDQFSAGNRDQLFDSRDSLREVTDRVSRSAWRYATPVCESVQKLLGNVLRHGSLGEDEAIALASDLMDFVGELLSKPAPSVGAPHIVRGSTPVQGAVQGQNKYEPKGDSIKVSLGMVDESRLGKILLRMGKVNSEQLTQALALQQVCRKRLGEVLTSMGILQDHDLQEALEEQRQVTLRMANDLAFDRGGLELKIGKLDS